MARRTPEPVLNGYFEVRLGREGYHEWYSQAHMGLDDLSDIAWVGGTPHEELGWEEGVEAPLRPTVRTLPAEWPIEREDSTRPSAELLATWAAATGTSDEQRERSRLRKKEYDARRYAQRRESEEAKARAEADIKRYAVRKRQPRA